MEPADDDVVFFAGKRKIPAIAGMVRGATRVIATTESVRLREAILGVRWDSVLAGRTYKVRLFRSGDSSIRERQVADMIWRLQRSPRVDMDHPECVVEIIVTRERAYLGLRAWTDEGCWQGRRAHHLEAPHPSGMHPRAARALVNLSCADRIHDPFCGAGGFLIEAGLSGRRASGGDIDAGMLSRARRNARSFKLSPDLRLADATAWLPRTQAIVTDLPYGKNTKRVELQPLLDAFLYRAGKSTSRMIVGLPFRLGNAPGWRIVWHAEEYVHGSLTRYFHVLVKATDEC